MTVSRALSDKEQMVNPDTVKRIKAIAEELGYRPNLVAKSLRGERLPTVVVFVEYIANHQYLADLVDAVAHAIEARHYGVIACQSLASLNAAMQQFPLAGAVILAPPESMFYDENGRPRIGIRTDQPVVLIHSAVEQSSLNEVSPDLADAVYISAKHLASLNHRHLGFIGGPPATDEPRWWEFRRKPIERALAERFTDDFHLTFQSCPHADVAPVALQQLLRRDPRITGVICLNDELAVAVTRGAAKIGRNVPRDLSVIGSNDIRLARFFDPPLTTLSIDVTTLVETGLNLLFDEIAEGSPAASNSPVKVLQKCQLIIRESTAPAPASPPPHVPRV